MKLTGTTDALRAALSAACKIAPRNSSKEILTQVKLEADFETVTLTATDMEMAVIMEVDGCSIETPGTVLLPAHRLTRILGVAGNEFTSLSLEGDALVIVNGVDRWEVGTMNPDEYPSASLLDVETHVTMDGDDFRRAVEMTAFCAEAESHRFALTATLMTSEADGSLAMVGTDGRRLSTTTSPAAVSLSHAELECWGEALVPHKAAAIVASATGETMTIKRSVNAVQFETEGATFFCRQVDGRYPNWKQVLPNLDDYETIGVSASRLASTIAKAAIMCDKESRGVDFNIEDGELTVQAKGEDNQTHAMMIVSYHNEPMYFTLDYKYVVQWLQRFDDETIVDLCCKDYSSPVFMRVGDERYVVMPMANEAHKVRAEKAEAEAEQAGEAETAEAEV